MSDMIVWKDDYNLGISEIDQQHRQLVYLLNDLLVAMRDGKTQVVIETIIDGLLQYAALHFDTEESYLTRYSYPETDKHKQEHLGFSVRIRDFQMMMERRKASVALEMMDFMTFWLNSHIRGTDRLFLAYLKRNEITVP